MLALLALSAQLTVTATAPDTVPVRTPVTILVRAGAPGREPPRIVLPRLSPFVMLRSMGSTRIEDRFVQGTIATTEYRLIVAATRTGTFTIPPFIARSPGETVRTTALHIVVREPPRDATVPVVVAHAHVDTTRHVDFHAVAVPDTVYTGQQSTYQVGVYLDDDVRFRLRRNPEFIPPEPRGMLAYEVPPPAGPSDIRAPGGRHYELHMFQRAMFPLAPGEISVPAAQLLYSLPLSSSFFSREESHALLSESLTVVVRDPPEAGRPADYDGAVGEIALKAKLDSASPRVGDPMLLTLAVSGVGNVNLFPRPRVEIPWAATVAAEERVRVDTTSARVRGVKEFDWVVTPTRDGRVELPPVRYPYFNPFTEHYEIAVTTPESVTVAPGSLAASDTMIAAPMPIRRTLGRPAPPVLPALPVALAIAGLAPLPALALAIRQRPRRPKRPRAALAVLRTLAATRTDDVSIVRRTYVRALATRLGVTPATLARTGELAHMLRREGVTAETADRADRFLRALDLSAYHHKTPVRDAARTAHEIARAVAREARQNPASVATTGAASGVRTWGIAILAATLLSHAATAQTSITEPVVRRPAAAAPNDPRDFGRAIAAYDARRFAEAERLFTEIAQRSPRRASAWANVGTAAFAAHHPVNAVIGWQRALRLDPLSVELRDRLALLPGQDGPIAHVPEIPALAIGIGALALWIGAWIAAARAVQRRDRSRIVRAVMAAGVAVALGVAAVGVANAQRAHDLAVVTASGSLRQLPALAADRAAPLVAGDIGRIVERSGDWVRLELDGGRDGWIERQQLVALEVD